MEVWSLHYKMTTPVHCGKLCLYNVIPRQPLKKLCKEIHSKTLHRDKGGISKQCSSNLQEVRENKTKKQTKQKIKNKMADLSPTTSITTLNVNDLNTPVRKQRLATVCLFTRN